MNIRPFAVVAALTAGAALLFVGVHSHGPLLIPAIGDRAAQAGTDGQIEAKAVPGIPGVEGDWQRYEFTVPPTSRL